MTLAPSDAARFMAMAEEQRQQAVASGDQSYGAVIVKDGAVVGVGPSRVVTKTDPTAHAEMEAIRDAAARLNTQDLSGCIMVSTSKPCPMCETAASWARLDEMIYTSALTKGGRPGYRRC